MKDSRRRRRISNLIPFYKQSANSSSRQTRGNVSSVSGYDPPETKNQASASRIQENCETRRIRGLINNGNTCFINVILQSLLSIDPFRKAVMAAKTKRGTLVHKFNSLASAMSEYDATEKDHGSLNIGKPFKPDSFFGIFPSSAPDASPTSDSFATQEDAEEFLSFLLNSMKEEERSDINEDYYRKDDSSFRKARDLSDSQGRRTLQRSIYQIFRGYLQNEVRRSGEETSITKEGFLSLGLNINSGSVKSVDDAIQNFFETDTFDVEDGRSNKTIQKQSFLSKSPQVLILHLQRFRCSKRTGSSKKVTKRVKFPEVLHIPDNVRRYKRGEDNGPTTFELSAVVTHLGSTASFGHYVCDVRFKKPDGSTVWLNCDDDIIREVQLEKVLRRKAYILFYTAI